MDLEEDVEICEVLKQNQLRKLSKVVHTHCDNLEKLAGKKCRNSERRINNLQIRQNASDGICVQYLLKTGSPNFDKIMLSLSNICLELCALVNENNFVKLIFAYGEQEGKLPEEQIAAFLPTLRNLAAFADRCTFVVRTAFSQIAGLLNFAPHTDPKTVRPVYSCLDKLLISLANVDLVIVNQLCLREHIERYKRVLKSMQYDEKLSDQIRALLKLITDMDTQYLQGKILHHVLFPLSQFKNPKLLESIKIYLNNQQTDLSNKIAQPSGILHKSHKLISMSALFVAAYRMNTQGDRRIFRSICDFSRKIGAICLPGNVIWTTHRFFLNEIPELGKLVPHLDCGSLLDQMVKDLPNVVGVYEHQVAVWCCKLDHYLIESKGDNVIEELTWKCSLLIEARDLAQVLNQHINLLVNHHIASNKAMSRLTVVYVSRMVCALTAIRSTLRRFDAEVSEAVCQVDQYLHYLILSVVVACKKRFALEKKSDPKKLDANAAIKLAEACLRGPMTKLREVSLDLCLEYLLQVKLLQPREQLAYCSALGKLIIMSKYNADIDAACDLTYLAGHNGILLQAFLSQVYNNNSTVTADNINQMLESFPLDDNLEQQVKSLVQESLITQLCKDIETDLRIQMHSDLLTDTSKPLQERDAKTEPKMQFRKTLNLCSIDLHSEKISIKRAVEIYLERIFYNLTSVALHDWKTYDEMRSIANFKYGLTMVDSYLPNETLDQGLDVLKVMRNMAQFCARYVYNMNNQTFIERVSNNKHLNTINITNIANSIRTHGPGITNTSVNLVYHYLKKQLVMFSQFMYDEQIKSRLIRDIEYFKQHREQLKQKYPYERAEKVYKSIRKLGVTQEGLTHLDRLRQIITNVGNAMGYVRMIRTGVLEYCALGTAIVPDMSDSFDLKSLLEGSHFNQSEVVDAVERLDDVLNGLVSQQTGTEGRDYYKMLVDAFEPTFCEERNAYLRNLYMLVPSLSLSYIEYMIACRDKLNRNNKHEAVFTDDGFVIGIAYLLRLTNQFNDLDSLHWFQSVDEKYSREIKSSQSDSVKASGDEKLAQTLSLTTKRIQTYRHEFRLLSYAFTSARIFFKTN